MSGPIVRIGATPEYSAGWERIFGQGSSSAKRSSSKAAKGSRTTKSAKKKATKKKTAKKAAGKKTAKAAKKKTGTRKRQRKRPAKNKPPNHDAPWGLTAAAGPDRARGMPDRLEASSDSGSWACVGCRGLVTVCAFTWRSRRLGAPGSAFAALIAEGIVPCVALPGPVSLLSCWPPVVRDRPCIPPTVVLTGPTRLPLTAEGAEDT